MYGVWRTAGAGLCRAPTPYIVRAGTASFDARSSTDSAGPWAKNRQRSRAFPLQSSCAKVRRASAHSGLESVVEFLLLLTRHPTAYPLWILLATAVHVARTQRTSPWSKGSIPRRELMRVLNYAYRADGLVLRVDGPVHTLQARVRRSTTRFDVPFSQRDDELFVTFADLQSALPGRPGRYDLLVPGPQAEEVEKLNVPSFADRPLWTRYFTPETSSTPLVPHIYVNRGGDFSVVVRNPSYVDFGERQFKCHHELTSITLRRGTLRCSFRMQIAETGTFEVERCYLKLFSNDEVVEVEASGLSFKVHEGVLSGQLTVPVPANLTGSHFALQSVLRENDTGARVQVRLTHVSPSLYDELRRRIRPPAVKLNGDRVLTASYSPKSTLVTFIIRPRTRYDAHPLRQSVYAAVGRFEARLRRAAGRQRRATALIFEKDAATAQDNGIALFRHLLSTDDEPGFDYAYVMDRGSEQWDRVRGLAHVVRKFSLTYWRLLASPSTFLASSDVRYHVANLHAQPGMADKYAFVRKNYFLQHGVTGLKRVSIFDPESAIFPDAVVATSDWEKQILVEAGVPDQQVDVTGFARWDRLETESAVGSSPGLRKVLYMPTWRRWLSGRTPEELRASEYAREIGSLLRSPELAAILAEHRAELLFLPHPKLKALTSTFEDVGDRVSLLNQDAVTFAEVVRDSTAIITDYSSTLWDFVQAHKSVLLFRFDHDRYQRATGMYENADLDRIMGRFPTAHSSHELIENIDRLLATDPAVQRSEAVEIATRAFPHLDRENSRRIVEHVTHRLPDLITPRVLPSYEQADEWYRTHLKKTLRYPRDTTNFTLDG